MVWPCVARGLRRVGGCPIEFASSDLLLEWPVVLSHELADFPGDLSYSSFLLSLLHLNGAIGQLLFDSTVWRFEPAQSQLCRQIVHHSFICAIFVSKPGPDCNDPAFSQLSSTELGEAPTTGQVILHLLHALVLQECVYKRLRICVRAIRHCINDSSYHFESPDVQRPFARVSSRLHMVIASFEVDIFLAPPH